MQVANYSRIDQYEGDIDCAIDRKLTEIALEPLNDKLSLNPRIFAAQNRILSRRLEVENLERYHSETRETR